MLITEEDCLDIEVKKNSIAIMGFQDGNAGQVASWIEEVYKVNIACFIVDEEQLDIDIDADRKTRVSQKLNYPEKGSFMGRPLLISKNWKDRLLELGVQKVLPLVPDNSVRKEHLRILKENSFEIMSAIHPTVTILPGVELGQGVWLNAGALIGYQTVVGDGCMINTGVQLDHHNVIEDCCMVLPRVTTAGNVTLREQCTVGMGALILERRVIGSHTVIGAGSVVTRSFPEKVTAYGNPAQVVRVHQDG